MSVKMTTFGAVRLTDDEARKFHNQLRYGHPSKAAAKLYARGKHSAAEYAKNGYAVLKSPA